MPLRCDSVGFLKPISEDESSTLSAPSGRLKLTGKDLTISRLSSAPKISRRGVAGNSTKVDGWTSKSLLRFKDFVQSIEQRNFLDGDVSAITLTTGKCPSPAVFKKMINAVIKELNETTGGRWIYCIEKTRHQKAPHVHLMAVFPHSCGGYDANKVISVWFKSAMKFGLVPSVENQDARDAWYPEGWARYMAKRDSKLSILGSKSLSVTKGCLPGVRMWGHGDSWSLCREDIDLTDAAHRIMTSLSDKAISIQLNEKGLGEKVMSSRKRLERYGDAAIVAPRCFRPSNDGMAILKNMAANPLHTMEPNGLAVSTRESRINRELLPIRIARDLDSNEYDSIYEIIADYVDEEMKEALIEAKEAEMEDSLRSGERHLLDESVDVPYDDSWMWEYM